jgi:3-dehydroshikimate dehydratase
VKSTLLKRSSQWSVVEGTTMLHTGLVSVTFRQLSPHAVMEIAARAGLSSVEWGGDIHVPPGDVERAREVRRLTLDHGLRVAAYGSYFRFRPDDDWRAVLETAVALGAPLVRVWAGERGSSEADAEYREHIVAHSRRVAEEASKVGIAVAYEYHGGTLTDTTASALDLLRRATGMHTLWQPPHGCSAGERVASVEAVLPSLRNVHVFHWEGERRVRRPLAEGEHLWLPVLDVLRRGGRDHTLLLEFVADDDPQQLIEDAQTLHRWLGAM